MKQKIKILIVILLCLFFPIGISFASTSNTTSRTLENKVTKKTTADGLTWGSYGSYADDSSISPNDRLLIEGGIYVFGSPNPQTTIYKSDAGFTGPNSDAEWTTPTFSGTASLKKTITSTATYSSSGTHTGNVSFDTTGKKVRLKTYLGDNAVTEHLDNGKLRNIVNIISPLTPNKSNFFSSTGVNLEATGGNHYVYIYAQVQAVCSYTPTGGTPVDIAQGTADSTNASQMLLSTSTGIPASLSLPDGVSSISCDNLWNVNVTCTTGFTKVGSGASAICSPLSVAPSTTQPQILPILRSPGETFAEVSGYNGVPFTIKNASANPITGIEIRFDALSSIDTSASPVLKDSSGNPIQCTNNLNLAFNSPASTGFSNYWACSTNISIPANSSTTITANFKVISTAGPVGTQNMRVSVAPASNLNAFADNISTLYSIACGAGKYKNGLNCDTVGIGFWSPNHNNFRTQCETTTAETTSNASSAKQITDAGYIPSGSYINTGESNASCTYTCNAGYYHDPSNTTNLCIPVGVGFWANSSTFGNNFRQACGINTIPTTNATTAGTATVLGKTYTGTTNTTSSCPSACDTTNYETIPGIGSTFSCSPKINLSVPTAPLSLSVHPGASVPGSFTVSNAGPLPSSSTNTKIQVLYDTTKLNLTSPSCTNITGGKECTLGSIATSGTPPTFSYTFDALAGATGNLTVSFSVLDSSSTDTVPTNNTTSQTINILSNTRNCYQHEFGVTRTFDTSDSSIVGSGTQTWASGAWGDCVIISSSCGMGYTFVNTSVTGASSYCAKNCSRGGATFNNSIEKIFYASTSQCGNSRLLKCTDGGVNFAPSETQGGLLSNYTTASCTGQCGPNSPSVSGYSLTSTIADTATGPVTRIEDITGALGKIGEKTFTATATCDGHTTPTNPVFSLSTETSTVTSCIAGYYSNGNTCVTAEAGFWSPENDTHRYACGNPSIATPATQPGSIPNGTYNGTTEYNWQCNSDNNKILCNTSGSGFHLEDLFKDNKISGTDGINDSCVSDIRECWQTSYNSTTPAISTIQEVGPAPGNFLGKGIESYTGGQWGICVFSECTTDYFYDGTNNNICIPVDPGNYSPPGSLYSFSCVNPGTTPRPANASATSPNPTPTITLPTLETGVDWTTTAGHTQCAWNCMAGYTTSGNTCVQNTADLVAVVRGINPTNPIASYNPFIFTDTNSSNSSSNRLEEVKIGFGYANLGGSNANFTVTYTYKDNIIISPSFFTSNSVYTTSQCATGGTCSIKLNNESGDASGSISCTINETTGTILGTISCTISDLSPNQKRYFEVPFLLKNIAPAGDANNMVTGSISNASVIDSNTTNNKPLTLTINPATCPYSFDANGKARIDRTKNSNGAYTSSLILENGELSNTDTAGGKLNTSTKFYTTQTDNTCSEVSVKCDNGKLLQLTTSNSSEVTFDKLKDSTLIDTTSTLQVYGTCFNNCVWDTGYKDHNTGGYFKYLGVTMKAGTYYTPWDKTCDNNDIKKSVACYNGKYYYPNTASGTDTKNPSIGLFTGASGSIMNSEVLSSSNAQTSCNANAQCDYYDGNTLSHKDSGQSLTFYKSSIPYAEVNGTSLNVCTNVADLKTRNYAKEFTCQNGAWVDSSSFTTDATKKLGARTAEIYTLPAPTTAGGTATDWKESCTITTGLDCAVDANGDSTTDFTIRHSASYVAGTNTQNYWQEIAFDATAATNGDTQLWCYNGVLKAHIITNPPANNDATVTVTTDTSPTSAGTAKTTNEYKFTANNTTYYSYARERGPDGCTGAVHGEAKLFYPSDTADSCITNTSYTCYNGGYYSIPAKSTGTNWSNQKYSGTKTPITPHSSCVQNCRTSDTNNIVSSGSFFTSPHQEGTPINETCTTKVYLTCTNGIFKDGSNNTQLAYENCTKENHSCTGTNGINTVPNTGTKNLRAGEFCPSDVWNFNCGYIGLGGGTYELTVTNANLQTATYTQAGGSSSWSRKVTDPTTTPAPWETTAMNAFNGTSPLIGGATCTPPDDCMSLSGNGTIPHGTTADFYLSAKSNTCNSDKKTLKCENGKITQVNGQGVSPVSATNCTGNTTDMQCKFWNTSLSKSCTAFLSCLTSDSPANAIPHGPISTPLYFTNFQNTHNTTADNYKFTSALRCNDGTFQKKTSTAGVTPEIWENITIPNATPTNPSESSPKGVYKNEPNHNDCSFEIGGYDPGTPPLVIHHGDKNTTAFYLSSSSATCTADIPKDALQCDNGWLKNVSGIIRTIKKDNDRITAGDQPLTLAAPSSSTAENVETPNVYESGVFQVSDLTGNLLYNTPITGNWYDKCSKDCTMYSNDPNTPPVILPNDDPTDGVTTAQTVYVNAQSDTCTAKTESIPNVFCSNGSLKQMNIETSTITDLDISKLGDQEKNDLLGRGDIPYYASCTTIPECTINIQQEIPASLPNTSPTFDAKTVILQQGLQKIFYTDPSVAPGNDSLCSPSSITLKCVAGTTPNTPTLKKVTTDPVSQIRTETDYTSSQSLLYYFGNYDGKTLDNSLCPQQCKLDTVTWDHNTQKSPFYLSPSVDDQCTPKPLKCFEGSIYSSLNIIATGYSDTCISPSKTTLQTNFNDLITSTTSSSSMPLFHTPGNNIATSLLLTNLRDKSELSHLDPADKIAYFPSIPNTADIKIEIRAKAPASATTGWTFYDNTEYPMDNDESTPDPRDTVVVRWEVRGIDKYGEPINLSPFFKYGTPDPITSKIERSSGDYGCGTQMLCLDDFPNTTAPGNYMPTRTIDNLEGKIQSSNPTFSSTVATLNANGGITSLKSFLSNSTLGVQFPELFIYYEKKLGENGSVENIDYKVTVSGVPDTTRIPTGTFLVTSKGTYKGFRSDLRATFSQDTASPIFNYVLFQE